MVPSKARGFVRDLVCRGSLPPLPEGLGAESVLAAAREQGTGVAAARGARARAAGLGRGDPRAPRGRSASAARPHAGPDRPRGARASPCSRRAGSGRCPSRARCSPKRCAASKRTVPCPTSTCSRSSASRDGVGALAAAGFTEVARGDHAWAFRDPAGHGILELHRSVVSAPGLYPLDREGLWARRREGRGQLKVLPSPEDLLLQLALHAAFQHGLVLSLAQWLDFRLVLEREPIDCRAPAGPRQRCPRPGAARRGARGRPGRDRRPRAGRARDGPAARDGPPPRAAAPGAARLRGSGRSPRSRACASSSPPAVASSSCGARSCCRRRRRGTIGSPRACASPSAARCVSSAARRSPARRGVARTGPRPRRARGGRERRRRGPLRRGAAARLPGRVSRTCG